MAWDGQRGEEYIQAYMAVDESRRCTSILDQIAGYIRVS